MSQKQPRPPVSRRARSASQAPRSRAAAAAKSPRGSRTFKAAATESAAGQWFRSMHLSLEMVTILAIVVVGILALAPQAQIWFQQRQQIADYQAQVQQAKADLAKMKVTRTRWEDPVYIRSQARDRLYYVLPGEVSYLVMDQGGINTSDVSGTMGAKLAAQRNTSEISSSILRTKKNWVNSIMESFIRAGLEEPKTTSATAPVGK
jgi:cell division protein FtsB